MFPVHPVHERTFLAAVADVRFARDQPLIPMAGASPDTLISTVGADNRHDRDPPIPEERPIEQVSTPY